ncbi:long-chain fatty acid--CoA ligase [Pedobacter sp. BS3]|uniref:AMP-dependent synthetase/ligase n=1 Tax=Pedobacter sp. BS3 TaxID=2567937 RepID=UPI0011EC3633|nr:long-chain fatty acid--CoA ligase [Pedobacter sp. BS3]TZF82995.1 long-chain fatty acid--CoA ligase [Pedobacter sp. BS3]
MHTLNRIIDLLDNLDTVYKNEPVVAGKRRGEWQHYTATRFKDHVNILSRGLLALGISPKDKVAIMSENRPEWNICDFAIMQIGITQVPMYPTLSEHDIEFILQDAGIRLLFVSGSDTLYKVQDVCRKTGTQIYTFDKIAGVPHWLDITEAGKKHTDANLQEYRNRITPDDLLTLIYTSGTTGTPKGVMLTHQNVASNVATCARLYPAGFTRALSFLPISHIFERMVIYMYLYQGISVYYAESMDTIVADINTVKPHGFTTVPRLLEKVYDKIVAKGEVLPGIKRRIFFWALYLALRYEMDGKNGWWYEMQLLIASKLVFNQWRKALGGNIKAIISGGAALQPRLARVFWAARMPVLEGYGLTETSPVIAVNFLGKGNAAFGTVGKPIKNAVIKIAEDGEILYKGPNLMKGYYNRPDLTAEVIDTEGFYHTGDIGKLDEAGFLIITDRKKEMFKTAGGKYIAPQVLENKFKESVLIEHIMVLGENRRFPSALIVPAFDELKAWCAKKGIPYTSDEEMVKNEQVIAEYQRIVDQYNTNFGHWEQVKKFVLMPHEWSIDTGELTPKLSFRRKVILEKHKDLIEEIYAEEHHEE